VESKVAAHEAAAPVPVIDSAMLGLLASNLKTVWSAPATDVRLKKRIVRTLIHEVVADIDDAASEIVLAIHWSGGAHSEVRLPKRRRGQRNSTPADIIAVVRHLVLIANDELIAGLLNRNGLKTGNGNRWTRERVTSLRSHYRIPVFKPAGDGIEAWLNLSDAARLLKVAPKTLRLAAEAGEIEAFHPLSDGPWLFARTTLTTDAATALTKRARQNPRYPAGSHPGHSQMGVPMRDCRDRGTARWRRVRPARCRGRAGRPPRIHAARQPFDKHVVPPGALPVHADRDVILDEHAGKGRARKLAALIGVEDLRPSVPGQAEPQNEDVPPSPNMLSTASTHPPESEKCYSCVRYELSPMSRVVHCARTSSPTASTKPTTTLSMPAATPGTPLWRCRIASHPLPQEVGQRCQNL
jgi:hypothetical protein